MTEEKKKAYLEAFRILSGATSSKEKVVKRYLRWRGKRYEEGHCLVCHQKRPIFKKELVYRSEPNPKCCSSFMPSFEVNDVCYKCLNKTIEGMERVASELRAATAGGEWEEPHLE